MPGASYAPTWTGRSVFRVHVAEDIESHGERSAGEDSQSTGLGGGAGVGSASRFVVRRVSDLNAGVRSRGSACIEFCEVYDEVDILIVSVCRFLAL
jgi:hypothetical protein